LVAHDGKPKANIPGGDVFLSQIKKDFKSIIQGRQGVREEIHRGFFQLTPPVTLGLFVREGCYISMPHTQIPGCRMEKGGEK
jgi:hypothetical protein